MKQQLRLLFFSVFAAITPTQLLAVPVTLEGDFTGGLYGAFNLQYDSAPAGLRLQSVTFDLASPLYLDPTFAPPGAALPLAFLSLSGGAQTGFASVSGVVDGSDSFTLLFNDFDAGEHFSFNLDIDGPCGGFLCVPGATTLGSEFSGTTLTATFGGSGYETTALTGSFSSTGFLTAGANVSGEVTATPEPATLGMLGVSLVLVGLRAKRQKRLTS
jgi:hypothetical protein